MAGTGALGQECTGKACPYAAEMCPRSLNHRQTRESQLSHLIWSTRPSLSSHSKTLIDVK